MGKGWVKVPTINDMPKPTKKKMNFSPNIYKPSYEELLKEGTDYYNKQKAKEDFLLEGFKQKQLKSKTLIKKAIKLNKAKQKAASTKENKKENNS